MGQSKSGGDGFGALLVWGASGTYLHVDMRRRVVCGFVDATHWLFARCLQCTISYYQLQRAGVMIIGVGK